MFTRNGNEGIFVLFTRIVFPASQLRRVQSSSQLQYAILGIRRRASPVPVKSRLDFPDVPTTPTQQLPQQAHGPAAQRGYPGQQNISVCDVQILLLLTSIIVSNIVSIIELLLLLILLLQ